MATGVTEFIDSTTADVFIPEIWSGHSIVARESALVYGANVDLSYRDELHFGDIINVGSIGNLAAQTKTKSSNAATVFETVTETNLQITIATWEYSAIGLESIVKTQANRDLLKAYAGKMGYALGLAVDDVLAGLPDDFTNALGTLAVENSYEDILRAIQYLDDANAPQSSRVFIVSPAAASGFLKMDKMVHNDYSKLHGDVKAATNLEDAYITSFLGIPIYKSVNVEGSNAAGHDNTLFHREALALVMQTSPKPWHMSDIDYFVEKVALEQLSGAREMRDDHGVFIRGA